MAQPIGASSSTAGEIEAVESTATFHRNGHLNKALI